MERTCDYCGESLAMRRADARFCNAHCRVYWNRELSKPLPSAMTKRARWVRHLANKRPVTVTGAPASSTNPATWTDYATASESSTGAGLGFVLGDGVGCWDLDGCLRGGRLEPWAADVLASVPSPLLVEVSMSGTGLHIFVEADEAPGVKIRDGRNIEFYSTGRYIAVTGRRFK